ncbi:MAG: dTDP-4-dehydrorhamnose reductase, partial [Oleibacter sp.]|nr:dTDP-4-dehydrorhamnose reductase [Thalassolituus sp.]
MKWLITGANGQLGQCLQDRLNSDPNNHVTAYDADKLDITDRDAVLQFINDLKPDAVINAAAYTAVDKAETEEAIAAMVNADAPGYLAEACEAQGIWFGHVSTDYVFNGDSNIAYCETDSVSPTSVYGVTKLDGEQRVIDACSKYFIVRTAWVFSEYGNNFVKTMLRLGRERDSLGVVADQFGCPTYAGDIADCLITMVKLATEDKVESGIYHFAGDLAVNWWSFTREIHAQALAL